MSVNISYFKHIYVLCLRYNATIHNVTVMLRNAVVPIPFPILLGFGIALFGQSESRYNALKCFCAVGLGLRSKAASRRSVK